MTRETAAVTQSVIEETLGLSRETFRASAFLAQGDGAAFTEAQPRERKAILAEVLGLDVWDRLLERAKQDHSRIEAASSELKTRIGTAGEDLERLPLLQQQKAELDKAADELAGQIATLEGQRTDAAKALTTAREAAAELKGAREVLATREAELQRVEKRVGEISEAERNADALRNERDLAHRLAERVPDLEHALAEARAAKAWHDEYVRLNVAADEETERARLLVAKANQLRGAEVETCERCGQELGADARERAIESYHADIAAADEKTRRLRDDAEALPGKPAVAMRTIPEIETDLTRSRAASTRVAEIGVRLEALDDLKAERELHERSLPEFRIATAEQRTKVEQLDAKITTGAAWLEAELAKVEQRLESTRRELAESQAKVGRVDGELERIAGLAERVDGEKRQLDELQAELDIVLLAERAYGRDGIPTLIVENAAIPQIEVEANRILAELGTSFTVELRTQRELKDGSGVREALDIVVCGPAGERPYETFSGGERTRLNLALRIALARLLAHRRGAEVRLLVIDEPEFLDEAGVARLAEVLRGLSADFERVFLISHQPALREAFDEVLSVVKDGDRSRVEETELREEIPA